jgi:hypothetical protein
MLARICLMTVSVYMQVREIILIDREYYPGKSRISKTTGNVFLIGGLPVPF